MRLKELAKLQKDYRRLLKNGITKKTMCELVIPFRDKWGLSDQQALAIARNEIALDEICKLMAKPTQTNADRIWTMSEVELANRLYELHVLLSEYGHYELAELFCDGKAECSGGEYCNVDRVKACIVRWLQQPAEGTK